MENAFTEAANINLYLDPVNLLQYYSQQNCTGGKLNLKTNSVIATGAKSELTISKQALHNITQTKSPSKYWHNQVLRNKS